ncbi:MAG: NAD(P)-dependent glycerol-3-phosphate dehydrogenase [Clostridiales Family XIII bacterium]|jgi:glycerol-3-phosphate dehydrogenase (NAD(P)+)|nr:NAD(P)-dependent glycerol-3-phosphate dehydrogenase [Clostridiales Family XIII bacterium]
MGLNICMIGAGSWGTALANLLAGKGCCVRVWDLDAGLLAALAKDRENKKYLPGVMLQGSVEIVGTAAGAAAGADFLVTAVPAQHVRSALETVLPALDQNRESGKGTMLVNVAKGIEQGSLSTISEVAGQVAPQHPYSILSGPSHAEEVGRGMPTTVACASGRKEVCEAVQDLFMTDRFRVYASHDVKGVELGGSLKNIIALGAGILDGMGHGDNTKAALMTRGLTEMARLGVALGAKRETFFGLSGIGDLIVTCTSMHSRNRRCGIMIGEGVPPQEAVARVGMVVEGVTTAQAAHDLARKTGVEMPITESVCAVVRGDVKPEAALASLMTREKKHESEDLRV